jgi:antitoxin component HigA of HigAB toxin-antitoxin module
MGSQAQVDSVFDSFSKTLGSVSRSLVNDAVAVRQLTALVDLSGLENAPPNQVLQTMQIRQLKHLDAAILSVEKKVTALGELVREEKSALEKFEVLKDESKRQEAVVEKLTESLKRLPQHQKGSTSRRHRRRDSFDPRQHDSLPGGRKGNNNLRVRDSSLSFARITATELLEISKNTRGRLTMVALNEALDEIASFCQQKFANAREDAKRFSMSRNSKTAERRYEYLQQQRMPRLLEMTQFHQGQYWVSEQELRENCAFFLRGEGTARATLVVLCALKRLKQLPGKNMEITYICLTTS